MIRNENSVDLERILEDSGVGWLLQQDREKRIRQITSDISELSVELSQRLSMQIDVLAEMLKDPVELKPLVQMFASPTSRTMRAMVYCVLRGMEIISINFAYHLKQSVTLSVSVEHNVTGQRFVFESELVWDVEILRHLGIMTMGKKPILHGFYAFAS